MLIESNTVEEDLQLMHEAGSVMQETGNLSENVAQTWDYCLDSIQSQSLWQSARELGEDFVHFLDSIAAMRRGYEARAWSISSSSAANQRRSRTDAINAHRVEAAARPASVERHEPTDQVLHFAAPQIIGNGGNIRREIPVALVAADECAYFMRNMLQHA
jgi:hypothetical protein